MLEFVARKPCRFQGKSYKVGDKILETVINRKVIGALIAMEILEKIEPAPLSPTPAYNKPPEENKLSVQEESSEQEESPKSAENIFDKKNKKKPPKVSDEDDR